MLQPQEVGALAVSNVQPQEVEEKITVKRLAAVLHETEHKALARVLKVLGEERSVELLAQALTIASQGGMRRKDDRRRKRSLGGTFLALCREQATPAERRAMFR
jgi:PHAX RNA-binding domain